MSSIKSQSPGRLILISFVGSAAGVVLLSFPVYGFFLGWNGLLSAEHLRLVSGGMIVCAVGALAGYLVGYIDSKVKGRRSEQQSPPAETRPRSPGRVTLFAFATGVVVIVIVFMVYSLFSGANGLSSADYFYLMRRLVIMLAVMAVLILYPMLKVGYWLRARKQSPSAEK